MNKPKFYEVVRAALGPLSAKQVQGFEAILDYYLARYSDAGCLAYMLATAWHETAQTMQPIEEYGKGRGYDYGKKLDMGKGPGQRAPYTTPDKLYYGRGLVQMTWRSNYAAAGKKLGLDLLNQPELLLTMGPSVAVLVEGMVGGWFTGKKVSDYFKGTLENPKGARRIINGIDQAERIAGYYAVFKRALSAK